MTTKQNFLRIRWLKTVFINIVFFFFFAPHVTHIKWLSCGMKYRVADTCYPFSYKVTFNGTYKERQHS